MERKNKIYIAEAAMFVSFVAAAGGIYTTIEQPKINPQIEQEISEYDLDVKKIIYQLESKKDVNKADEIIHSAKFTQEKAAIEQYEIQKKEAFEESLPQRIALGGLITGAILTGLTTVATVIMHTEKRRYEPKKTSKNSISRRSF